jgi:hypothetical protein
MQSSDKVDKEYQIVATGDVDDDLLTNIQKQYFSQHSVR